MAGHIRILKETNDNIVDIPEAIDVAEDSGFTSIAGSLSDFPVDDNLGTTPIAQDVKFYTINVEEMAVDKRGIKRKAVNTAEAEAKKKAEEEYNNQKREQVHKRLMHLLTKSKFYASYICDKINVGEKSEKGSKKPQYNENAESSKHSKVRQPKKKSKMNKYVSSDMKQKLNDQNKKMNLSKEDIENELNKHSDSEQNTKDQDATEFVVPKYFQGTLREYQMEGLQWLKVLYENGVNGILADEMGLGKTIQVIALFAYLLEKRQNGPYLIIAPLSTIPNWMSEFERFAPNLPIVLFHGTPETVLEVKPKMEVKHKITDSYSTYPIVLTTYEYPIKHSTFLARFKWRYIVIDEGHRIKNQQCQLLKALHRCDSLNRLLLTGTPLQNNLAELWSLLNFLLPEIFDDLDVFESWFNLTELQMKDGTEKVLKLEQDAQILASLREILKPFMLRRMKEDVCLDIPPRKEVTVYAPLTELQHDLYRAVLNRDLEILSRIEEQSLIVQNRSKRRCLERNQYSSSYQDIYNMRGRDLSRSTSPMDESGLDYNMDENSFTQRQTVVKDDDARKLDIWRQYTDIDDRNQDFFIRLRFGSNTPMFRQIVNHPWLMHCPLDSTGRPEVSERMVMASGKLLVLDAMLKKLKARGHKVLLFSTMTMILDIIADYLTLRPWRFLMLDGRQDIVKRQENIKIFNEDPDVFLFLISTRAGGIGLNLAAADTVIVYDSDWNPQADLQAMARCHRIGQTRPVVVYRLCTKGTIDERITARADAKRKLEKMVISKELKLEWKNTETLLALQRLLNSTDTIVVTAEKEVYTDAELNKILDRSDLHWPSQKQISSAEDLDSA